MSASRIVLAGNAAPGVRALDLLLEVVSPGNLLVIAPPRDSPPCWQESLADAAVERGVALLTPADVNDSYIVAAVRDHRPALLLSVHYTQLFRAPLLAAIDGPAINLHPSLLPRHRGASPLTWAIAEGDRRTGLSVHYIDAGVDTGPIIRQYPIPIHPDDTGYMLHLKMARLAAAAVADLLRHGAAHGELPLGKPQAPGGSVHRKRDGTLNALDLAQPAERVRNVVRALAPPLPGAYVSIDGEPVTLVRVEPVPLPRGPRLAAGTVQVAGGDVLLWASDCPVRVTAWHDGSATLPGHLLAERFDVRRTA